ncbi:hypothetical protein NQ318_017399 [Aromia moschata]|uniref:3-hydroxyisobutyryl-CoA hydrolase, mitochondrial n=1 Tax=Aromia moschata TaxID=1265417 RepID=A0AAV8Z261_9CUCU|nr:hypothetical protein NQ318_017399 [Aromia moschata]
MMRNIYFTLREWKNNKRFVLIKGAGDKAFCAGGYLLDPKYKLLEFIKYHYPIYAIIGSYAIPYIALIDGIVMGAGVGLSIHGRYRVATERTVFAMPEAKIGLFPDAGTTYFLPRLTGRLGWFLGLTGHRLKGPDTVKLGIATHYCKSENLKDLEDDLLRCSNESDIKAALDKFHIDDRSEFTLAPVLEKINYCFSADTMEEILSRLEKDGSKWAEDTTDTLLKMSPTSLKITLKLFDLGQRMSLPKCLQMEYRVCFNCIVNDDSDFYKGVKALLIDKGGAKWNPPTVAEVSEQHRDDHFSMLQQELDLKNKL